MAHSYSIIIPFYGTKEVLEKTLLHIQRTDYRSKEIIIVNDGTNLQLDTLASAYGAKLINHPFRRGPSAARNSGASAAQFDHLVFLDSDVYIPEGTFRQIDFFLDKHQDVNVLNCSLSPRCLYRDFISRFINLYFSYTIKRKGSQELFTAFCIIKSRIYRKAGGFDEQNDLPYADDEILGWKLSDQKCKFAYLPGINAVHDKHMNFSSYVRWNLKHRYYRTMYYFIYRKRLQKIHKAFPIVGPGFLIYTQRREGIAFALLCAAFLFLHHGIGLAGHIAGFFAAIRNS